MKFLRDIKFCGGVLVFYQDLAMKFKNHNAQS